MKTANLVSFRVFSNPYEDADKIKSGLLGLLGYSEEQLKDEKIKFSKIKAKGFSEKTIIIFEAVLEKNRHCNLFLKRLIKNLSEKDKKSLLKQTNRLDDNLNFYIRLDKEELMKGNYVLTDIGSCYHIKISVAAFRKEKMWHTKSSKIFFREQIKLTALGIIIQVLSRYSL